MTRRDPDQIPAMSRWNAETGGRFGVENYLGQKTDPENALILGHLLWPAITEVRGCVLRASVYSADSLDSWWTACEGNVARIEAVMNHLHLWDVFPSYEDEADVVTELADLLVATWSACLTEALPDRALVVERDDHYGPGITFHSR